MRVSSSNRIAAFAAYVPRFSLSREAALVAWPAISMAGTARSVLAYDEDVLTMAAHAAMLALESAGTTGCELGGIFLATCSGPYTVKSGAAVIADYVGASRSVCLVDAGGGVQAGLLALIAAIRDQDLISGGPLLVVASDAQQASANTALDLGLGAAAAAFVVTATAGARMTHMSSRYSSQASVWLPSGERELRVYEDERFERHAGYRAQMKASLREFEDEIEHRPDWYALSLPPGGNGRDLLPDAALTDRLVGCDLTARVGDCGCANSLLSLGLALQQAAPGETVLAQAYGAGAGTITALIVTDSEPLRFASDGLGSEPVGLSYVQFAKQRGLLPARVMPAIGAPWGASPGAARANEATLGLVASKCKTCGSLNFPRRHYCLDCRGQSFERVKLPRTASVVTFNIQHVVGIGPEEAPLPICTALMDGEPPGRYAGKVAALLTDTDADALAVGTPVELIPRRGDVEQGLIKYGWKFRVRKGER